MSPLKKKICEEYERLTTEKTMIIKKIWQIEFALEKINEKVKKYGLQKDIGLVEKTESDG